MAEFFSIPTYIILMFFLTRLISAIETQKPKNIPLSFKLVPLEIKNRLHFDPITIESASADYGHIITKKPLAVLHPSSPQDIITLIRSSYSYSLPFSIAARGRGHSVSGQAMAEKGVVVEMTTFQGGGTKVVFGSDGGGAYADVGGGELWRDVLNVTMEYGLAPVSWTDYLYLTIGGTLSNAGISGQTFQYGPQISNVYELDVVTGKGEFVTCSPKKDSELFYGVLGGLGQFGIITRARIPLRRAPKMVKWVRMLYSDFSIFTKDQEYLISIKNGGKQQNQALDYVEGSLLMDHGSPNNWRSSFFPPSDHPRIMSMVTTHGIIYCLEFAKYYDDDHAHHAINKELQLLSKRLSYLPGLGFEKDVSYIDFLDRVRSGELKLQSQGLWDVPHPWLNLFVPKSRISDFNIGVFRNIVLKRNITTGPVLVYPMHRNKWDDRMSAVIPDEDTFYTVGFLHSSGFNDWEAFDDQNKEIMRFCEDARIEIKQYFPYYTTKEGWIKHFGSKWKSFSERKVQFDPKMILSPGQRIFNNST